MTLSILIVNWNSKDYLRKCLQTVYSTCEGLAPQIVVVDGASFDGCSEMLAAEFADVEFIQSSENVGFGRANNLGFERVTGDTLLLLNPDCELTPSAVSLMVEQLYKLPDAGIIGVRLLRSDGTLQTSCVQALPTPINQFLDSDFLQRMFPRFSIWGTHQAFNSQVPVKVEAVTGACMLMRTAVFRHIKGFSPQFFMYGEDLDLCFKVGNHGLHVYHIPSISIIHHGGGSSGGAFSKFSAVFMIESVYLYILRNQNVVNALIYRALMALSSIFRIILLAPASVVAFSTRRHAHINAIKKWFTILRWSIWLERWTAKYR